MPTAPLDRQTVLDTDPWLVDQVPAIIHRHDLYRKWKDTIEQTEGGYDAFTKGYEKLGLNVQKDNSVVYREWAPNATEAVLTGDFSRCPAVSAAPRDADPLAQTSGTASRTR